MWNLNDDTSEPTDETETDSQTTDWRFLRRGGGSIRSLGLADANYSHRMDKQQDPTIQLKELYSISCDKP